MEMFKNTEKFITILIIFDLFRYLYDNNTDSCDNWTDYNDIESYLLKRNYTEEQIEAEFKRAMNDRN